MEFIWIIGISIFLVLFTDVISIFGIGRDGKAEREKEDEKYSFKKMNDRINKN
jgi:hypothetical protein